MTIRTDDQLKDGTYGTTGPIQPQRLITSERHRDIIDSKVSRYSIENPDSSTPEGQQILSNNQRQEEQDDRLDSLEDSDDTINGRIDNLENVVVKSVDGIYPDATGNVKLQKNYSVGKFQNVWSGSTGAQLPIIVNGLSFIYQRASNGTYLPYITNNTSSDINIWYRTTQRYDSNSSAGISSNSLMTISSGTKTPSLDNDSNGLGYGNYPNETTIEVINNDTGDYYIWKTIATAKGSLTSGGAITAIVTNY